MHCKHSVTWSSTWPKLAAILLLACGAIWAAAVEARHDTGGVTVEVVDEQGRSFAEYPLTDRGARTYRAYLEARRGAPYRLRVRNHTGERVGVVIAVDGRNIVSGARSDLTARESMYVLDPWQSADYRGWRTSLSDVHEFYFTEWPDSYAEAFGDRSAQGVIAMAVYRDRDWQRRLEQEREREQEVRGSRANDSSSRAPRKSAAEAAAAPPGTGFGERRHDPAQRVEFHAESRPFARSFIKYEWADTLCRKGIACERNRFWPDDDRGFAPYPPSGRR